MLAYMNEEMKACVYGNVEEAMDGCKYVTVNNLNSMRLQVS